MDVMLLIYLDPAQIPAPDSPQLLADREVWTRVTQEMADAGVLRGGAPLDETAAAQTVRAADGEEIVTDGPFAETKEILGGYYLLEVDSFDEAAAWAKKLPNVTRGSVEVRRVLPAPPPQQ